MLRLVSVILLICLASPALAQKSKAALTAEINTNWPDNSSGRITPAKLRATVIDIVNSYYDFNGNSAVACAAGQYVIGMPTLSTLSCAPVTLTGTAGGDLTGTYPNPILATVNSNVGTFGSSTDCVIITVNAKGLITAASTTPCAGGGGGGSPGGSSGQIQYNNSGSFGGFTTSGDLTINTATGVATLASTIAAAGPVGSATVTPILTYDAKGRLTTVTSTTTTPAIGNITGLGTGVATALAVNIGSAGAPVVLNGAGGTPSAITLTNGTGLPVSGLANASALTLLGRSANSAGAYAGIAAVAASDCVYRESGSTLGCGTLATAGIANNAVTLVKLATQAANTVLANGTSGAAVPTAFGMPSCSGASNALQWLSNTGFQCGTLAAGGSVTSATVAAGSGIAVSGTCTITTTGTCTVAANNSMGANKYQVFTAGASGTLTTPTGAAWVKFTLVGGGAGGGGGGTASGGTGTTGNNTCINTSGAACTTPVYQAGGGAGGTFGNGGAGGTVSGSSSCTLGIAGSIGAPGMVSPATTTASLGGSGGSSSLGGAGAGLYGSTSTGLAAAANSGSGGGGGSGPNTSSSGFGGGGGGSGATCIAFVQSPAATYTYAVAGSAAGGTAGTSGGAGGTGGGGTLIAEFGFN